MQTNRLHKQQSDLTYIYLVNETNSLVVNISTEKQENQTTIAGLAKPCTVRPFDPYTYNVSRIRILVALKAHIFFLKMEGQFIKDHHLLSSTYYKSSSCVKACCKSQRYALQEREHSQLTLV